MSDVLHIVILLDQSARPPSDVKNGTSSFWEVVESKPPVSCPWFGYLASYLQIMWRRHIVNHLFENCRVKMQWEKLPLIPTCKSYWGLWHHAEALFGFAIFTPIIEPQSRCGQVSNKFWTLIRLEGYICKYLDTHDDSVHFDSRPVFSSSEACPFVVQSSNSHAGFNWQAFLQLAKSIVEKSDVASIFCIAGMPNHHCLCLGQKISVECVCFLIKSSKS